MKKLLSDAYGLTEWVFDTHKGEVVTVLIRCAPEHLDYGIYETNDGKGKYYAYFLDETPSYLKEQGIIEYFTNSISPTKEFSGKVKNVSGLAQRVEMLEERAQKLSQGYFWARFNLTRAKEFLNFYNNKRPGFSKDKGLFTLGGKSVRIEPKSLQSKLLGIMTLNSNSIVPWEELVELLYGEIESKNMTKDFENITDKVDAIKKELEAKFSKEGLSKILIFVERNGLGMFIDKKALNDLLQVNLAKSDLNLP